MSMSSLLCNFQFSQELVLVLFSFIKFFSVPITMFHLQTLGEKSNSFLDI